MSPRQHDDPEVMRRMHAFAADACRELGLDPAILDDVTPGVLRMVAAVAHGAARPAAPLSALLVGLAAGRAGGGTDEVTALASRVEALVGRWEPAGQPASEPGAPGQDGAAR